MGEWQIVREGRSLALLGGFMAIVNGIAALLVHDLWAQMMMVGMGSLVLGMSWGVWGISRERQRINDLIGRDAWYGTPPQQEGKTE